MINLESSVRLSVGKEASSSQVVAVRSTAEAKNEDDTPAKSTVAAAKKAQERSA